MCHLHVWKGAKNRAGEALERIGPGVGAHRRVLAVIGGKQPVDGGDVMGVDLIHGKAVDGFHVGVIAGARQARGGGNHEHGNKTDHYGSHGSLFLCLSIYLIFKLYLN